MIDIVFQLLVFFVMTFKVVDYEGDFNIKMPLASEGTSSEEIDDIPELIIVKLTANADGDIANVLIDSAPVDSANLFGDLTRQIESRIASDGDPDAESETEVEFDIQPELKYLFTVKAIDAVSGRVEGDNVKKLIQKIKFKDNSEH